MVASAEKREHWRTLIGWTFAALASNSTLCLTEPEMRQLVANDVSAFIDLAFGCFLGLWSSLIFLRVETRETPLSHSILPKDIQDLHRSLIASPSVT